MEELASVDHLGRQWLFNDHGHRTLEWDDHCNRAYTRWVLREHGLTLTGLTPESFIRHYPHSCCATRRQRRCRCC